jgi:hypothetical protein
VSTASAASTVSAASAASAVSEYSECSEYSEYSECSECSECSEYSEYNVRSMNSAPYITAWILLGVLITVLPDCCLCRPQKGAINVLANEADGSAFTFSGDDARCKQQAKKRKR